jgi:cytochrome c oxidase subunit III
MASHTGGTPRYYVPESSRLAICAATALGMMLQGVAHGLNAMKAAHEAGASWYLFFCGLALFLATLSCWFYQSIKENMAGMASPMLKRSYRMGMQWFIFSEVMFFCAFFGALFYVRNLAGPWLAGEGDKGMTQLLWKGFQYTWPQTQTPQQAVGIANQIMANNGTFNAPAKQMHLTLALINTVLLLSSSVTVHFAHVALKNNKRAGFNLWLALTLILGFTFVGVQAYEYYEAYVHLGLTLKAGIYGSTFFMLTGFHGFHVCMGAIMLSVQWLRSTTKKHFTADDHFGFEAASWYWHFVDVVWVGLFLFVYIL